MYMVSMLERNTQKKKRILSNGYIYCVPGLEDSYLLTSVLPKLIYTGNEISVKKLHFST